MYDFLKLPPSEEAFENHSKFFSINPKNILNVSPSDNKNLAENRNDQAKFRSLRNKIPFLHLLMNFIRVTSLEQLRGAEFGGDSDFQSHFSMSKIS